MRDRVETSGKKESLKTGRGGMVDIEFLVQLYQIHHGRTYPTILRPNIWESLDALATFDEFEPDDIAMLHAAYSFYRRVEARMRIVSDRPMTTLPVSPSDRDNLARRLGFFNDVHATATEHFLRILKQHFQTTRRIFQQQAARLRQQHPPKSAKR